MSLILSTSILIINNFKRFENIERKRLRDVLNPFHKLNIKKVKGQNLNYHIYGKDGICHQF